MDKHLPTQFSKVDELPYQKRGYQSPTLMKFGNLAALTQAASGCSDNDSGMCSTAAGNMGPKIN